ncbi:MAG: T9SS type A sorting domain-containing protein [Chitinophagaceae bacterium]|nr:T9SS type A sorting domain-containing protein [Chitinophagaceae bacterium]
MKKRLPWLLTSWPIITIGLFWATTGFTQTFTAKSGVSMATHSQGYYEYLPMGYAPGSQKYPLLIFLHDVGEIGNGTAIELPNVLTRGTPKQIVDGDFPTSFTVGGTTYRFIVLAPQFTQWPTPNDLNDILDYAKVNYPIDTTRMYLTGISMGAGLMWEYAGTSVNCARRISAMVPVSGATPPLLTRRQNMAAANLPVWATHNSLDGTVPVCYTEEFVNGINAEEPSGSPTAKMTIFTARGHDAWTATYDPGFTEGGMDVYEWMLQFQKYEALPVTALSFTGKNQNGKAILNWSVASEVNHLNYIVERSKDGTRFESLSTITPISNNGFTGKYSYTDIKPESGTNFYRLKLTSVTGNISYSDVIKLEFNEGKSVTFFPTLVNNTLNLKADYIIQEGKLRIFDMSGRMMLDKNITGSGTHSVSLTIPSGMYSVVLTEKGELISRQTIIKQ